MKNIVSHLVWICIPLLLFLGIPAYQNREGLSALFRGGSVDALTGATLELPAAPSGEFVVLLNRLKHPETLAEWTDFFLDEPVDVIFEDLSCLVAESDSAGMELAQRYQARLAEHQMTVKSENGLLVASKAQYDRYDVIILSKEAADAYTMDTVYNRENVLVLTVKGAQE